MAIRVFIKRHFKSGHADKALAMLNRFRNVAMTQPGYISGETLVNHYDERSITVVSTWQNIEDWVRWQESENRVSIEAQLKDILEKPTKYEVYDIGRPDST